jgi:NAD(P)-dependent dehydrogenase (short-subunit alcohol dehydrogenase family)
VAVFLSNEFKMASGFGLYDAGPEFHATRPSVKWENKSSLTKRRDTYSFIDPFRFAKQLTGKVVLITQSHRGIGRSTSLAFAQAGASVCCVGPTAESLEPLLREIKEKFNTPTLALTADLMQPAAPAQVVDLITKHRGPVDILINITPAPYIRPLAQESDIMKDWWPHHEASVRVPITLIQAVLPSMVQRQTGIIISTVLVTAHLQLPYMSQQGVSKAALLKFHHHLELEMRSKGIMSFAVNVGPVPSHLHDPNLPLAEDDPNHWAKDPQMQASLAEAATDRQWPAAGLASGTFVALCADPRARILSGLYVNAERDLEEVITRMESDWGRKVERDRLYVLKVDEL